MFRAILILTAAILFLASLLVDSRPAVAPSPPPGARDVRAARTLAMKAFWVASQDGATAIVASEAELAGAAALVSHGAAPISGRASIAGGAVSLDGSLRLAERSWLNGALIARADDPAAAPDLWLRLGRVTLPPALARPALNLLLKIVWKEDGPAPRLSDLVETMSVTQRHVVATLSIPPGLGRSLRALSSGGSPVSAAAARKSWSDLSTFDLLFEEDVPLEQLYARAFALPMSAEAASGVLAGIAAAAVSPRFLRLADPETLRIPRDRPAAIPTSLAGRDDLAKHFAVSAAIAASDPDLGRALGEWKELDDSLPGGSGFSFVDLAADRAGTRLGAALADPARTGDVQRRLRSARAGDLFPAAALGMSEGLDERTFQRRFGRLDSAQYRAAVTRIDAALDAMPLYQDMR